DERRRQRCALVVDLRRATALTAARTGAGGHRTVFDRVGSDFALHALCRLTDLVQVQRRFGRLTALHVLEERRDRDGGKDADNRDDDHELDESKAGQFLVLHACGLLVDELETEYVKWLVGARRRRYEIYGRVALGGGGAAQRERREVGVAVGVAH